MPKRKLLAKNKNLDIPLSKRKGSQQVHPPRGKARFNIARSKGPRTLQMIRCKLLAKNKEPRYSLHKRNRQKQVQPPRAESPIQHSEVRRASNHTPARFEGLGAILQRRFEGPRIIPTARAERTRIIPLYKRKSTQKLQPARAESPIQHSEVRRASDHSPARFEGPRIIPQLPSTKESPHKNCSLQGLKARFNIARFEGPRIIPQRGSKGLESFHSSPLQKKVLTKIAGFKG